MNSSKMKKPKITIITVVFNGADKIEKTLNSVITQNYDDYEYIVVDGESTDETVNIIKKYNDKIDIFISEKDKGISDAFNKGIKMANGEWVGIVNCGDYLLQGDLRKVAEEIAQLQDDERVDILRFQNNMKYTTKNAIRIPTLDYSYFPHKFRVCHMGCYIRTKILKQFLYNEDLKICMDIDLLYRLHAKGISEKYVNTSIGTFVVSQDSVSVKQTIDKVNEIVEIAKRNGMNSSICSLYFFYLKIRQILAHLYHKLGGK